MMGKVLFSLVCVCQQGRSYPGPLVPGLRARSLRGGGTLFWSRMGDKGRGCPSQNQDRGTPSPSPSLPPARTRTIPPLLSLARPRTGQGYSSLPSLSPQPGPGQLCSFIHTVILTKFSTSSGRFILMVLTALKISTSPSDLSFSHAMLTAQ